MVFFGGANLFVHSTALVFKAVTPKYVEVRAPRPIVLHRDYEHVDVVAVNFVPEAVVLDYADVHAPPPVALHRDQEYSVATASRVLFGDPRSGGVGGVNGSAPGHHVPSLVPLPRPLAPLRSHSPPVAVVEAFMPSNPDSDRGPLHPAPPFSAPGRGVSSGFATSGLLEPPRYLVDAVNNLNAALRHVAGLAPIHLNRDFGILSPGLFQPNVPVPDRDLRLFSLEAVRPSLSIHQFRALREEVLFSPFWYGNHSCLSRHGQPIRCFFLRVVPLKGDRYGARLYNVVERHHQH